MHILFSFWPFFRIHIKNVVCNKENVVEDNIDSQVGPQQLVDTSLPPVDSVSISINKKARCLRVSKYIPEEEFPKASQSMTAGDFGSVSNSHHIGAQNKKRKENKARRRLLIRS